MIGAGAASSKPDREGVKPRLPNGVAVGAIGCI
jgi:hypothetical protein